MKSSTVDLTWSSTDIPIQLTVVNGSCMNSIIMRCCRCIDEGQMDVNICDIISCVDVWSVELNGAYYGFRRQVTHQEEYSCYRQTVFPDFINKNGRQRLLKNKVGVSLQNE